MPALGVCFPREFAPADLLPSARAIERAGVDDLWVVEDCFFTAAPSLAAAALVGTERINVGVGILPGVVRNPAITAMELATLAELAPGRLIGGIGHGVQEWMAQIGARQPSPLTALSEVLDAVRALLRGERVSVEGRFVRLQDVQLDRPPQPVPPVLAGVFGPKSLALAGRHADGLVLADWPVPDYVRTALRLAGGADGFPVTAFAPASLDADRAVARLRVAGELAASVLRGPGTLRALPFYDELATRVQADGTEAVLRMPDDWWLQCGAIGTPDDAAAHVRALADAGADRVTLFLPPDRSAWQAQLALVGNVAAAAVSR
ncbi:MAG TPA: LLM class flavin-dependent oxidoreductase [Kineosporiaceae bacterium]|nr:LLM class flavin-dependent oxidoreductase [Kineosporiaceae bacterium]